MRTQDELRRTDRIDVCCRADVSEQHGVWTAVTEDLCSRGCRLVTTKLPRIGSTFDLTLSSDLFPEQLDILARTVWVSPDRVGVTFLGPAERRLLAAAWLSRVVEHGSVDARGAHALASPHVVPAVHQADDARGGSRVVIRFPRTGR